MACSSTAMHLGIGPASYSSPGESQRLSDGPPKQISFGFIKGLPGRLCSPFGPGDRFGVLKVDMGV